MLRTLLMVAFLLTSSSALCPLHCTCTFETTDCSKNEFTSIPSDIDQTVKHVNVSYNAIYSLPKSINLKNLQIIDLSHNSIQIANFSKLENLKEINLSHNALNEVIIQNLPILEKLDLSHNKYFSQQLTSKSLKHLDISNTSLNSNNLDFRQNLSNLTKLILAQNSISSIAHLRSNTLEFLDVSKCNIQHLRTKDIKNLSALTVLTARDNPNMNFSLSDHEVPLEIGNFANCGVEKIHISGLKNIQDLDLSFNEIQSIGDRSFEFNLKLSVLNIASNQIKEITNKAFIKNPQMTVIDVSNNSVVSVKWTHSCNSVKFFNASFNKIYSMIDIQLQSAKIVDLSHNLISLISTDLSGLPNIEALNLRYNIIEHIKPLKSKTLERLMLGYCKIRVLELQTFAGLSKLQYLDLEGNQLKEMNYLILAQAGNLRHVLLGGNAWTCDCSNENFKNLYFYLMVNHTLTDPESLTCWDRQWTDVCIQSKDSTKLAGEFHSNAFVWLGVFFIVALATGLGLLYCKGLKKPGAQESPPVVVQHQPLLRTPSIRRVHSAAEIPLHRASPTTPVYQDHPPPPYEVAVLMPPLTETERMTRSMEVFLDRSN